VSAVARLRLVRLGLSEEYEPRPIAVAAVAVLAPLAFAGCLMLGGGGASWWWVVFAPAGAATVAYAETPAALVMWAMLLALWVAQVPGPFTWWSVPAAVAVAAGHTALTLLAGRPPAGGLSEATARRSVRRLGIVSGAALGVAVLTQAVRALDLGGQLVLAVAAVLVVAAWAGWGWWQESARGAPPP
jgi:hypothetical protein